MKKMTVGRAKISVTHLRLAVTLISCNGNGKVVEVRGVAPKGSHQF